MKVIKIALFVLALAGCQSLSSGYTEQVPISFTTVMYNSIAEKYFDQYTYAITEDYKYITVFVTELGSSTSIHGRLDIWLSDIDQHIAAVEKYLSWENLANARKDLINKDIASFSDPYGNKTVYSFFSANRSKHLLMVSSHFSNNPVVFDLENAKKYLQFLKDYKSGSLSKFNESNSLYQ